MNPLFGVNSASGIDEVFRACYISVPLYLTGFLVLGAAFQEQLSVAALVFGWGLAQVAIMVGTVAVYAYCNDCFPRFKVC